MEVVPGRQPGILDPPLPELRRAYDEVMLAEQPPVRIAAGPGDRGMAAGRIFDTACMPGLPPLACIGRPPLDEPPGRIRPLAAGAARRTSELPVRSPLQPAAVYELEKDSGADPALRPPLRRIGAAHPGQQLQGPAVEAAEDPAGGGRHAGEEGMGRRHGPAGGGHGDGVHGRRHHGRLFQMGGIRLDQGLGPLPVEGRLGQVSVGGRRPAGGIEAEP